MKLIYFKLTLAFGISLAFSIQCNDSQESDNSKPQAISNPGNKYRYPTKIYLSVDEFLVEGEKGSQLSVVGCHDEPEALDSKAFYLDPNNGPTVIKRKDRIYTYQFSPVPKGNTPKPGECEILWGPEAPHYSYEMFQLEESPNVVNKLFMTSVSCSATVGAIVAGGRGLFTKGPGHAFNLFSGMDESAKTLGEFAKVGLGLVLGNFWCHYHLSSLPETLKQRDHHKRLKEFLAFVEAAQKTVEAAIYSEPRFQSQRERINQLNELMIEGSGSARLEYARIMNPLIASFFNKATAKDWSNVKVSELEGAHSKLFEKGQFSQNGLFTVFPSSMATFDALREASVISNKTWRDALGLPNRGSHLNGDVIDEKCTSLEVINLSSDDAQHTPVFADENLIERYGNLKTGTKVKRFLTKESALSSFKTVRVLLDEDSQIVDGKDKIAYTAPKNSAVWIHPIHLKLRPNVECLYDPDSIVDVRGAISDVINVVNETEKDKQNSGKAEKEDEKPELKQYTDEEICSAINDQAETGEEVDDGGQCE